MEVTKQRTDSILRQQFKPLYKIHAKRLKTTKNRQIFEFIISYQKHKPNLTTLQTFSLYNWKQNHDRNL